MEPRSPSPPPASPFQPIQPGPPRSGGPSRARPLLIGCGVVLVLLGIAAVVLVVKARDLTGWVFHKMEAQIMARLPADVTPEERQRLDAAFDSAADALARGTADPARAQALNSVIMEVGQPNRPITREDVLKLTRALEATAGKAPPGS